MGSSFYGTTSILVAEARALRDGLQVAIQAGIRNLNIEGDNKIVIQAIEGKIRNPWHIQHIIGPAEGKRASSNSFKCLHSY